MEMTEDTRRALEIIAPMAKHLNIQISAERDFLLCNGQAIGISANSTWATVMEFLGYVFMTSYKKDRFDRYGEKMPSNLSRRIKTYWVPAELYKRIRGTIEEGETHGRADK